MDREYNNLDHVNGYWCGKRSRLFHSIGCSDNEMLPVCAYQKPLIVEWNEQGIVYDKERVSVEYTNEVCLA